MNKQQANKRNQFIITEYNNGTSVDDLAVKNELSRERVRQILIELNPKYIDYIKKLYNKKIFYKKCYWELFQKLERPPSFIELNEKAEIKDVTGIHHSYFAEFNKEAKKKGFKTTHNKVRRPIIDKNKLIEALKILSSKLKRAPNSSDIKTHKVFCPDTYRARFGTFMKALEIAGLKPNKRGRRHKNHTT